MQAHNYNEKKLGTKVHAAKIDREARQGQSTLLGLGGLCTCMQPGVAAIQSATSA